MASQSFGAHHRHFLLCPVCRRTHSSLPVHLRRVCMKKANPETIRVLVEKAKQDVVQILRSGRMFSFGLLHRIMEDAKPSDVSDVNVCWFKYPTEAHKKVSVKVLKHFI